jgi:hypothetical protein
MSAGKPAVAPDHTAMAEYVSASNSFVVNSWREPGHWPHDPRLVLRCHRYRIDWESLCTAYLSSWRVAIDSPGRYRSMSLRASKALKNFCSADVVAARIDAFLGVATAANPVDRLWRRAVLLSRRLLHPRREMPRC